MANQVVKTTELDFCRSSLNGNQTSRHLCAASGDYAQRYVEFIHSFLQIAPLKDLFSAWWLRNRKENETVAFTLNNEEDTFQSLFKVPVQNI